MKEFELSKYDFEALDDALTLAIDNLAGASKARIEKLKDLFAKAHSATLFIEEEQNVYAWSIFLSFSTY